MDVLGCWGLRGRCRDKLFFTASFRAPGERVGSSPAVLVGAGAEWPVGAGPGDANAYPEDTGQVATRPPLEDSGSSAASARWAQSRSGHAGACPSLGLAT